ncbi:hypothetical protein SAMN05444397_11242 [Flavobacterium aquidurense]|nr:hypothetical protein SAMN05444397_11242 [Flavobacterium aquidurense]
MIAIVIIGGSLLVIRKIKKPLKTSLNGLIQKKNEIILPNIFSEFVF